MAMSVGIGSVLLLQFAGLGTQVWYSVSVLEEILVWLSYKAQGYLVIRSIYECPLHRVEK